MAGASSAGRWGLVRPQNWSSKPSRWRWHAGIRSIPPVHHSDKGCQYTSLDFTNRLYELGLVPSYGSTGDCYDNAAMETFWATLKRELSWIYGPLT